MMTSLTNKATTVEAAVIQSAVEGSCPRDTQTVVTARAPNPADRKSYLDNGSRYEVYKRWASCCSFVEGEEFEGDGVVVGDGVEVSGS